MKVAVIGSREIEIDDFGKYLPMDTTLLISGGAKGVDACVKRYAQAHNIPLKEFLPDYRRYGKGAPLKRNESIVESSDLVLAFWDGQSKGTANVIELCIKWNRPVLVYEKSDEGVFLIEKQKSAYC